MKTVKIVLLIEQCPDNRDNFTEILELAGYKVLPVGCSIKGITLAIAQNPDIIICNLSGLRKLQCERTQILLKSHRKTKNIPLMITTTNNAIQFRESCARIGVEMFLLKPFSMEMMVKGVGNMIHAAVVNRKLAV